MKTKELIENIESNLEKYDISGACNAVPNFIDAINNWYIRRSRPRFWKHADDNDSKNAYDTLYTVLLNVTKALSPLIPLIAEEIYTKLTKLKSVHLSDWPSIELFPNDKEFLKKMDIVREISSAGLAIRKSNNIRVRQPLHELTIVGDNSEWIKDFENYITDEVNIKRIKITDSSDSLYKNKIKINLRKLGPKLGKDVGKFMQAANNDEWIMNENKSITILDKTFLEDEYILEKESLPGTETRDIDSGNIIVSLNINIDEKLEIEGIARDILRAVQNKRKDMDLDISDMITINIFGESKINKSVEFYKEYIATNSLAKDITFKDNDQSEKIKISDNNEIFLYIIKV